MPNVTYGGTTYPCAKALKGADYIHLLDSNGCMIAAFDGITDFTGFTIDTDWTTPTPDGECYLAVIGDDGVIRKGTHKCCDIPDTDEEEIDIDDTPTDDSENLVSSGGVKKYVDRKTFANSAWQAGSAEQPVYISLSSPGVYEIYVDLTLDRVYRVHGFFKTDTMSYIQHEIGSISIIENKVLKIYRLVVDTGNSVNPGRIIVTQYTNMVFEASSSLAMSATSTTVDYNIRQVCGLVY